MSKAAKKQVIVIGAGPGGLAAAMLLARAGARVKVVERLDHVGGRTSSFGGDGFTFDLGPTFFLYPRVLESVFAAVGRDLHEEVELIRLDPQYHLVFGGGGELHVTMPYAMIEPLREILDSGMASDRVEKDDRWNVCLREEIEDVRPGRVSLMPSGFDQQLTPRELADLVAFLKACK